MMSNYKRTVWKDSPETEITAELLNNIEEGIEKLYENVSNPNLFINGNFQIWSNGEEFSVKINDDGTYGGYVVTADRWTVGAWSSNTAYVYRTDKGLTFAREQAEPIDVFQVLEEETLKSILGKPLTMSYQTLKNSTGEYEEHVRSIVLDENIEIEPFAIAEEYFSIELEMGYTLCWAKLEVGEIATPCIPDSKDAIICKLENESKWKEAIITPSEHGIFYDGCKALYRTYNDGTVIEIFVKGMYVVNYQQINFADAFCTLSGFDIELPHNCTAMIWNDTLKELVRVELGQDGTITLAQGSEKYIPIQHWLSFTECRFIITNYVQ